MKRYARPVLYGVIVVLALLALMAERPVDASRVAVVQAVSRPAAARTASPAQFTLHERRAGAFNGALFNAPRAAPVVETPVQIELPPSAPPVPDLKILGWMQAAGGPHVFVELNGESHTLTPGQSVGDLYRFDAVGGGFADFTLLSTGESRRYAVTDPALLD